MLVILKSTLYGQTTFSGERVVNKNNLTKLRLGSNWYAQTDITEVIITLVIIFHINLKFFISNYVNDFSGDLFITLKCS